MAAPPLVFEENRGQAGVETRFRARGDGMLLELRERGASFHLRGGSDGAPREVRFAFVGTREHVRTRGDSPLTGVSHYYRGDDPSRWILRARRFARVRYDDLYAGVGALFYSKPARVFEYDLLVSPGTDPSVIGVRIEGADAIAIDDEGNLVIEAGGERLLRKRPCAYQTFDRERREVAADYRIDADGLVRFEVAAHAPSRVLVIDPVLTYATYLGGTLGERIGDIAVDAGGNVYVSGVSGSTDFPTVNAAQPALAGGTDFVALKLSKSGTLVYSTYVGGSSFELFADGMAVDANGAAHITGQTISQNYPTTPGAWDATCGTLGTCNGGFVGSICPFLARDPDLPPGIAGRGILNFTTGHKQGRLMDLNTNAAQVAAFDLTGVPFDCSKFLLAGDPGGGTIVGVFPAVDAPLIGTLQLDLLSSIRFTGESP